MGWLNDAVATAWRGLKLSAGPPGPLDDYWYETQGSSKAGVRVTPDLALKASALYAVVKVLAETMGTMPLKMFREGGKLGRLPAPDHPLDEVIRYQPNTWQTAVEFWEMMIFHATLRGTAYAQIVPGARGAVDQLWPLHPDRVRVERLPDRSLRFRTSNPHPPFEQQILLQEEVFRIPGLSSDGVSGIKVIDVAADAIGLGLAADTYAARVFSNKLNIGGFLVHPGKLSPDAQKRLITALAEKTAGADNAHRPVVLQEGFKFERGTDNAKNSQLLEARKYQVAEIARFFRVPLHMLDIDDQTNRATVEAQAIDFVKYTLRPWGRRIEQAIRRDLIVKPDVFRAKYNFEGLLRGDSADRADYFAAALGSSGRGAWMTPNEVRIVEGMNPSTEPGSDILGGKVADASEPTGQPFAAAPATEPKAIKHISDRTGPERLVGKEVAAIRRAATRFAGDAPGFEEWLRAFFGGHVSQVMELLEMSKEEALAYCFAARDELLAAKDMNGAVEAWVDKRAATLQRGTL